MSAEFEQLIKTHSGRIMAIAKRYGDSSGVDDLYQEILVQLWRSFDSFRGDAKPQTWIYRIGFNTAMTSLRKLSKDRQSKQILNQSPGSEAAPGGRCQAEILDEFMQTLDEVDTSIMMMYLDGLSGKEMSSVLGMKLNAVQVRITRLKTTFAQRYLEVA